MIWRAFMTAVLLGASACSASTAGEVEADAGADARIIEETCNVVSGECSRSDDRCAFVYESVEPISEELRCVAAGTSGVGEACVLVDGVDTCKAMLFCRLDASGSGICQTYCDPDSGAGCEPSATCVLLPDELSIGLGACQAGT